MPGNRNSQFKRVPAVDKCVAILDLLAQAKGPLRIQEISTELGLNKSTVFNMVYTLADLQVLEHRPNGKFAFGTRLYLLGKAAGSKAELIRTVHSYLQEIAEQTYFSAFLGVRLGRKAVIIDKVDAGEGIKVSSEVGMRLPLIAGASGKALLSQLPESKLDELLSANGLMKFTPYTCVDRRKFKESILKVRQDGVAVDLEEYLEGIVAAAVPVNVHRKGVQAAIWAVGLKRRDSDAELSMLCERLKRIASDLDVRFGSL